MCKWPHSLYKLLTFISPSDIHVPVLNWLISIMNIVYTLYNKTGCGTWPCSVLDSLILLDRGIDILFSGSWAVKQEIKAQHDPTICISRGSIAWVTYCQQYSMVIFNVLQKKLKTFQSQQTENCPLLKPVTPAPAPTPSTQHTISKAMCQIEFQKV